MSGEKFIICSVLLLQMGCSDTNRIVSSKPPETLPSIEESGTFEVFYLDWFWSNQRTSIAASRYFINFGKSRQTLPTFGGFVFDLEWNLQFVVYGGWYRDVSNQNMPVGPEIFKADALQSLYAWVGHDSIEEYEERSYALVFKSYGNRSYAEIKKRISEWLEHKKTAGGHGAPGFLISNAKSGKILDKSSL